MVEGANITGYQPVCSYAARQLSRAEQRRVRAAKAATGTLKGLHATFNQLDHSIRHQEGELSATRAKIRDRDAREHRSEFSGRAYWSVIGILALLEVPLNTAALDFLRRPEIESLGIALFIGAVTALAAKFTGRILRQNAWRDQAFRDWGMALVFNFIFVFAIFKVAELRGLLAGNASAGTTVLALQLVGYAAMVGFSYAHVDPDGAREQLTRLALAQELRLRRVWGNRGNIAGKYNKTLADTQLALADIEHDAIERVVEYRDYNMRHRNDAALEYFRRPVTRALFSPIDLGAPLDAHAREIGEVSRATPEEENDND